MVREEFLRINGLRLRVTVRGAEGDPPAVLLHGGALMGSTWQRVCDRLPGYRFIVPDLRGHGDSEWAPADGYALSDFAGDLVELIAACGLDRPHLVGMSLGGQTALHAVCHGLDVRSLCLVDVGPSLRRGGARKIVDFVGQAEYPDFDAAVDAALRFNPRRTRASLAASLQRSMRRTPAGGWAWKWDPARLRMLRDRNDQAEALWPLLGRVRCPTLAVRGEDSPLFTEELAERFAAALPDGATVGVPGAGHAVQSDQPERLAAILARFWDKVDAAPATLTLETPR